MCAVYYLSPRWQGGLGPGAGEQAGAGRHQGPGEHQHPHHQSAQEHGRRGVQVRVYYLPRVGAVLSGACQVHRVEPRPGPAPEHGDQDQTQRQL